ncbi:amidohydrolase family protein [Chryseolinea sp. T2]|uniref:amidohydrolase family protein n=1 Tax=Chryseolinea sp. T2 TaxID=3129255 RepID=UPI0030773302
MIYRCIYVLSVVLIVEFIAVSAFGQNASDIRLKDYRPVSTFNIPKSHVVKAKYPVIDVHSHDYPDTDQGVDEWVKTMDAAGIERTIILSYKTGAGFDSVVARYARYKDRFELWCGFDYTGYQTAGWQQHAVAELERCWKAGARGVGELGDKGLGEFYSAPTPGWGMHVDDPRMKPLFEKCAQLKMPVNIHVAEDTWNYLPGDSINDGLMNADDWKVDMTKSGILNHNQLIKTLDNVVKDNPNTTFIACHLANTNSDLNTLGRMFDAYPNLYADVSARYSEFAAIPRFVHDFIEKYSNRILYGTDMGVRGEMYQITFRILETNDEHFYYHNYFSHHWPLHGLNLSDRTLRKVYNGNARRIMATYRKD